MVVGGGLLLTVAARLPITYIIQPGSQTTEIASDLIAKLQLYPDHYNTIKMSSIPPTLDLDDVDAACFDVELADEAIGSTVTAIRSVITKWQKKATPTTVFIKFTNVPPHIAEQKISKACRQMFDRGSQLLLITVPSGPHEWAARNFTDRFRLVIIAAGIAYCAVGTAGATRVEGSSCSKEPDDAMHPISPTPLNWPSIVVEVGMSEFRTKLKADAAWWIANSEGRVNVVITIDVKPAVAEIVFQSIILRQPVPVFRNRRQRFQTEVRQSITVTRHPGGRTQPITTIPNTPLMISCQELLRRPAVPPEVDPNITVEALEDVAWMVWEKQNV
ncbi:hypothetical protein N7454_005774 [Penicillium verhagenii]|nr:hypothetical protein N7454_005774 [Penicillium verhagenii]